MASSFFLRGHDNSRRYRNIANIFYTNISFRLEDILLARIKITVNKNKRNLFHSGEGFLRLLCKKFTATMSWLDGINFSALLARTTRRVMKMLIHKCLKRLPGRIRRMLNLLRLSSSAMNVSCAWIYAAFGIQLSLQNKKTI